MTACDSLHLLTCESNKVAAFALSSVVKVACVTKSSTVVEVLDIFVGLKEKKKIPLPILQSKKHAHVPLS